MRPGLTEDELAPILVHRALAYPNHLRDDPMAAALGQARVGLAQ